MQNDFAVLLIFTTAECLKGPYKEGLKVLAQVEPLLKHLARVYEVRCDE